MEIYGEQEFLIVVLAFLYSDACCGFKRDAFSAIRWRIVSAKQESLKSSSVGKPAGTG
ncbi:hypothetical protein [Chlorobium phaeovibrioides]|uniref:hypothetical protein n=1 Tax=Chlorobium phaeovibrioides TaxID=1094 RepID=UPI0017879CBB|nr:hypothetical protein [Chlorobium phaeovibrioides]